MRRRNILALLMAAALCLCLLDQLVVGFLKQILKINQMLKVSHG